jgi:hypothetical protein
LIPWLFCYLRMHHRVPGLQSRAKAVEHKITRMSRG